MAKRKPKPKPDPACDVCRRPLSDVLVVYCEFGDSFICSECVERQIEKRVLDHNEDVEKRLNETKGR